MPDLRFINAALTRTGNNVITSLTEGGAEADVANQNYETVVENELGSYRWKFAKKSETLSLLDGDTYEPWLYTYQLPTSDLLLPSITHADGVTFAYEVRGTKLLTNWSGDSELVVTYIYRPAEAYWPPYFAELVTRRMEAIFLRAIGERYAEAEKRDEAAERQAARAKLLDSQSQPGRDPRNHVILRSRGSPTYAGYPWVFPR